MGLSSSKSKTQTTSNETGSMTPTNPPWVDSAIQGFTGRINDFGKTDPYSYVAPASSLQQSAFDHAGDLGGWKALAQSAADRAAAVSGGANTADPTRLGAASTYNAPTYNAPGLGAASTYDAPKLGNASAYDAPVLGGPTTYTAPQIAAMVKAKAHQGSEYLNDYLNPYTNDVVDTTLANYDDQAARVRAQQAAEGAANGAFGGSRFAIREAQTEGDLARQRAATEAGLRSDAFNTAAGYGMADADRFTNTDIFNAGQQNQRSLAQAQLRAQAGLFNSGAANDFALAQGQLDSQAGQFNAAARNQFAQTQAGLDSQAGQFNAGAKNQFALSAADLAAQAGMFNAGQQAQAGQFNAGARNQFALQQGALDAQNSQFNAGQRDAALQRQLAAAGLLGDLANSHAANSRGDLTTLAGLGDEQRSIDQQRRLAPLMQLEAMGQLYGATPFQLFNGHDVTSNSNSTSTTTSKPSLFSILMQMGQTAAQAYAGGTAAQAHAGGA